jgi:hypothetical protein
MRGRRLIVNVCLLPDVARDADMVTWSCFAPDEAVDAGVRTICTLRIHP